MLVFSMREVSIITLGVRDIVRSTLFYERMGFERSVKSSDKIVWFRTGSTVMALYPWKELADDIGIGPEGTGFRGCTFALNFMSKEEVKGLVERARQAGARVVKEPKEAFWGGFSAYFEDPDGHMWEAAWNPYTPVDDNGRLFIDA
jgi:predicted lactoylglutathione lyase